ncbi:MAG TPA: hypothetical protein VGF16_16665 [Bryobacteraceae bacterium]|jgi:hypothetical protein
MTAGDKVTVFPLAAPERRAVGEVVIAAANSNSLALAFPDKPPFAPGRPPAGFAIHPDYGAMLLLLRDEKSWPFWRDLFEDRSHTYYHVQLSIKPPDEE